MAAKKKRRTLSDANKELLWKARDEWWSDPKNRVQKSRQCTEYMKNPKHRQIAREAALRQWADPKMAERISKKRKKIHNTKTMKDQFRERSKRMWANPVKRKTMIENMRASWERKAIIEQKKKAARAELKANPEYDVMSNFYTKEKKYLFQICKEIMNPYGLEPVKYASYFYYEEIVEHFRPGWLVIDRKRRYGGIDPLSIYDED